MIYTLYNHSTHRVYKVESLVDIALDIVWDSQKSLFFPNTVVTVKNENGQFKVFRK